MFDYANSLATAQRLLTNFGRDVTIKTVSGGTYNNATQTVDTQIETTFTAKAVLLDYKKLESGNSAQANIEIDDKKLLVSPVGLTAQPNANDLVVIDTVTWNIVNVKTLKPASITVLYELQIRKA